MSSTGFRSPLPALLSGALDGTVYDETFGIVISEEHVLGHVFMAPF